MAPPGPLLIPRLQGRIDRAWLVPGSKSLTNRALVLAALADGTSVLENVLESDDTQHMRRALLAMGIGVRDGAPGQVLVDGGRQRLRVPDGPVFLGNSGTSVRFLAALAALIPGATTLTGDAHMAKRPIQDLCEALAQLGVRTDCPTGCPPLTIHGGTLTPGRLRLRADRSSQYASALLLALGGAGIAVELELVGEAVSRPYLAMSARLIRDFGGAVEATPQGFRILPAAGYRARSLWIEPDASGASYPAALAAAGGHRIRLPRLDGDSLQGDYAFLALLERMGATVERAPGQTTVSGQGGLRGISADLRDISDTAMTLAALAPLCQGPVRITGIGNIRIKETDRLAALVTELTRLGQAVRSGPDWLTIEARPLTPGQVIACYHDHRMAMSFAVLGAMTGMLAIEDPACTAKTYPGFWDDLAACYPVRPW